MKTTIKIAVIAMMVMSLRISAQKSFFELGFKAGLNLNHISNSDSSFYEFQKLKQDFLFGIFTQFRISDILTLQPELMYSQQGGFIDIESVKYDGADYNYFNIPLILKTYPSENGFNIHGGPQIGFLISGSRYYSYKDINVDISEELNPLDFSVGLGLGYDTENFVFEARYNFGINSTQKSSYGGSHPLRTIQLSFGIKI